MHNYIQLREIIKNKISIKNLNAFNVLLKTNSYYSI